MNETSKNADGQRLAAASAAENNNTVSASTAMDRSVSMEDFALIRVLGKGAYGKVFLVRKVGGKDSGCFYAMKVIKKERLMVKQKTLEHAIMEREVLERLRGCPFIVNMVYAFQSDTKLHIVMEYVGGGELFTHLCKRRSFDVAAARIILGEVALALNYVHNHAVVYRDLKLENILLDPDGHVKLTDFGLSKAFKYDNQDPTSSYCGTVEYMAPEIIKRSPNGYTKNVDFWSLGVIAFELLTGCSPFTVEGNKNSAQDVAKRVLYKPVPYPKSMDNVSQSFINSLLDRDPQRRLGAKGFDEIKNHEFFAGLDWDLLAERKVEPPIRPFVHGQIDVNNFAPEFTNQKPVFTPADTNSTFQSIFRGYSFVSPSVIFSNDNIIGEESFEENLAILSKNSPFFSKYEVITGDDGFLGRGTFSVCRKCRRLSDGAEFAVKIVSQKFAHHALREIRILELVNPHPNIVGIVESMCDPLHYYIVLEYLSGGELLQRIRSMVAFTESRASRFMKQLVSAVSHIHSRGAVHRDIKPENIIFENGEDDAQLKLVDFGFARLLPNSLEALNTPCFTLAFAAPEVLEMEDELPNYNSSCDLWSLGVILFMMLSGKVPFHAKSTSESANDIIARIRAAEFSFDDPVWDSVSDMAKDLITGLLTVDPKKRLSLVHLSKHEWLRQPEDCDMPRELQTPTVLHPTVGDTFNETMNAFLTANKDGFHLMDVDTAPLLVKRRGMKRRSSQSKGSSGASAGSSRKVSGKLQAVSENDEHLLSSPSKRPSTLQIDAPLEEEVSPHFTEYRDPRPPDLKYSRDVHDNE